MEDNNCPKPNCGRPESTHRYAAGKKLSICGNGHSWDQAEIAARRANAREAEARESKPEFIIDHEEVTRRMRDFERRIRGHIFERQLKISLPRSLHEQKTD